jgi:uncharacterized LabA/DUF88 family protein
MRKAIAYIDGYNLYYSRLRGTPFKWLDLLVLLDQHILRPQAPDAELVQLKYFTAPAKAKFATHGKQSEISQNEYHRALRAKYGERIDIVTGYHTTERVTMLAYEDPPDKDKRIPVWRIEEKQTDVNIALAMYRDALRLEANLIVLCSNDSDLVPAVKLISQDCPDIEIGIIAPVPPPAFGANSKASVRCASRSCGKFQGRRSPLPIHHPTAPGKTSPRCPSPSKANGRWKIWHFPFPAPPTHRPPNAPVWRIGRAGSAQDQWNQVICCISRAWCNTRMTTTSSPLMT